MDRCLAGFLAVSENLDRLAKASNTHVGFAMKLQHQGIQGDTGPS